MSEVFTQDVLAALAPPARDARPLGDMSGCEAAIAGEAGVGYRQGVKTLLETGPARYWPRSGPAFGGKDVFILPRTVAAQAPTVQCQFGLSTTAAGYDAFHGILLCSPPPQVYVVAADDALAAIASRFSIASEDILRLNAPLRDRGATGLRVGETITLQPAEAKIVLLDARGHPIHGEEPVTYRYAPLSLRSFAPRSGVTSGGEVVTLLGSGFVEAGARSCEARCRFGGSVEVPAKVISPTEMRCIVPPLPTQELDAGGHPGALGVIVRTLSLEVTMNGADYTSAGLPFSYYRRLVCVGGPPPPPPAPRLAIVAAPKSFVGAVGEAQRNAIRSWLRLVPRPHVLLASRDPSVLAVAQEYNVDVIPDVETNTQGTPLLNSIFDLAEKRTNAEVMVFVNGDIVLFDDVPVLAQRLAAQFAEFLVIGRRTNVNATLSQKASSASSAAAWHAIRAAAKAGGEEHTRWALDYFIFTKSLWGPPVEIPPFAIGRPAFDNWLVRRAVVLGKPVVDASHLIVAMHQAHDYAHVQARTREASELSPDEAAWAKAVGGDKKQDVWEGMVSDEIRRNQELAGPGVKLGTTDHSTWVALPCGHADSESDVGEAVERSRHHIVVR